MAGESSLLSLVVFGSLMKAEFGVESATGTGNPEFDVPQSCASVFTALLATQPGERAEGVTLSKASVKIVPAGPDTMTEAEALPLPPLLLVKLAVLFSVTPHVFAVVALTT